MVPARLTRVAVNSTHISRGSPRSPRQGFQFMGSRDSSPTPLPPPTGDSLLESGLRNPEFRERVVVACVVLSPGFSTHSGGRSMAPIEEVAEELNPFAIAQTQLDRA